MRRIESCVWCDKPVRVPHKFDSRTQDVVCSDACATQERAFRFNFSDEAVGEANYKQFGINPNHRGQRK